ncbi:MAG: hypothetical protein PHQ43_02420 [Dehalococcoidales bacterium]|nr:hypothetical protein [Dehalococcoidales bacterium]
MANRYYGGGYGLVPQALGDVNENIYRMLGDYRKSKEDERAHNLAMQKMDLAGEAQKTSGLESLGTLGLRKQQNENQRAYQERIAGLQEARDQFDVRKWDEQEGLRQAQLEAERARTAASRASAGAASALQSQRQYELQQSKRLQAFMDKTMTAEEAAREAGWGPNEIAIAKAIGGDDPMSGKAWMQVAQSMTPKMKVAMQLAKIGDEQKKLYDKMVDPNTKEEELASLAPEYVNLTNTMRFVSGLLEGKEPSKADMEKLIGTAFSTWETSPSLQHQYPDPNDFAKTVIETAEAARTDPRSVTDLVNMNRDSVMQTRQANVIGAQLQQIEDEFGPEAAQEVQKQVAGKSFDEATKIIGNRRIYYENPNKQTGQPTAETTKPPKEYTSNAGVLRSGENLYDEGGFGSFNDNEEPAGSPAFSNGVNKLINAVTPKGPLLGEDIADAYRMAGMNNIRDNAVPPPPGLIPTQREAFSQPRQVGNIGDVTGALQQTMRDRYRATKPPGGVGLLGGDYSGMNPMPGVKDAMNQIPQRKLSPIEYEAFLAQLQAAQNERYRASAPQRPVPVTPIPDYTTLHKYLGE